MSLDLIKQLIAYVEWVGLDTQSLRDLSLHYQSGRISLSVVAHLLSTLNSAVEQGQHRANSQPTAIRVLLSQLGAHIQEELARPKGQATSTVVERVIEKNVDSGEVLSLLRELKTELQVIKDRPSLIQVQPSQQQEAVTPDSIGKVFVDVLDNKRVDAIKANVRIESKRGDSLAGRLERLKKLRGT